MHFAGPCSTKATGRASVVLRAGPRSLGVDAMSRLLAPQSFGVAANSPSNEYDLARSRRHRWTERQRGAVMGTNRLERETELWQLSARIAT
jgi:hypothetical protein